MSIFKYFDETLCMRNVYITLTAKVVPGLLIVFFFFLMELRKKCFFSANQNSPICMKTTDIKLYSAKFIFYGVRNNESQQIRR